MRRRVVRSRAVAGTAFVVALITAQPASAKDMCFSLPGFSGGVAYAFKSFRAPGKNRCKAIAGFSTTAGAGWLLDGTACTAADGTVVRLALRGQGVVAGLAPFQGGCTIPLPSLTGGGCLGTFVSGGTHIGWTSSIDLSPCAATVP